MTRGTGRGAGPHAAPSSTDVARLAGVSQKTVSRVLNDEPYVSADVRRRVTEAAEQLGYRRNNAARALASGRTRSIGVVTLGTALYGPASLLMGVERVVRNTGYALRVVNTVEGDPAGIAGAVDSLLDQGVDGIVISEPIDEAGENGGMAPRAAVPVLVIGAPPFVTAPTVLNVGDGAELMARTATKHLLGLGHTTVHHLAGPQRWYAARDRLEGWRSTLTAQGRDLPEAVRGDWSAASGYAAGRELAENRDVTAVFAANDDMAIGLIRALAEAGRRVPQDVSVVGFDDIPVAAYVTPPLTTVRQLFDAVAQEGLKRLVHAIENPDADPLPPSDPPVDLVVRASTAPPPSRTTPARGRRAVSRARVDKPASSHAKGGSAPQH
ncbi:LacI family DNA-binding transcriptional regulator [Streptomyces europaeiscabiei]|uniref:LacI family DNA-binding transcriptional regulator n=1 Tax=Streptomyces europaeiscabiei TaxID=146819 RepID=A0ABU4NV28_9ACTN|nr:LacI family DNA-binding transcriptional regulator [Streptomyces europaeiscabiei]MDX2527288.1 LacI family DNA-binding transcriptional regulator [Streptomyces europaeiscabiei]MDX3549072.1 LacI family DNA-binding transcriptional regulator [Streptomyces europaeiscabiei]MDX3558290.1 LacI family DNA-binding transcriptional regulator [Streptomyces europaeiscabiei]MDX3667368.1 LacI family DNA-binding transcriptional regulator [Streptomyces europaeiscabiei]MDX3706229.1 LacI family DNA-binding transc